jgi:hypothetical protein
MTRITEENFYGGLVALQNGEQDGIVFQLNKRLGTAKKETTHNIGIGGALECTYLTHKANSGASTSSKPPAVRVKVCPFGTGRMK